MNALERFRDAYKNYRHELDHYNADRGSTSQLRRLESAEDSLFLALERAWPELERLCDGGAK